MKRKCNKARAEHFYRAAARAFVRAMRSSAILIDEAARTLSDWLAAMCDAVRTLGGEEGKGR